jgi:hypothetical protein
MYFNQPRFTARPIEKIAKEGGMLSLAVGGQPEREAAYQSVSMNDSYPMAQLKTPMYSDPSMQRPMAREVINPSGDVGVDDFTGQPRMAGGGIARYDLGGTVTGSSGAATMADGLPKGLGSIRRADSGSSPTKAYAYNPKTQEFTETTTTPAPAPIRLGGNGFLAQLARQGVLGPGYTGGMGSSPYHLVPEAQQQAPSVVSKISGGIMAPYMPAGQENMASGGMAGGGYNLGGYSDGGRLLRGPGDGVSDSIPASIGDRQPARLADGEFVVPARIVSEIGNGSTEAGARKLYAMMERVQRARRKTVGKNQVAKNTKAERLLPA